MLNLLKALCLANQKTFSVKTPWTPTSSLLRGVFTLNHKIFGEEIGKRTPAVRKSGIRNAIILQNLNGKKIVKAMRRINQEFDIFTALEAKYIILKFDQNK